MPAIRRPAPPEWLDLRPAQRRRTAPAAAAPAPAPAAAAPHPRRVLTASQKAAAQRRAAGNAVQPVRSLRPRPARIAPELQRSALHGYTKTHRFPGANVTLEAYLATIRPHLCLLIRAALARKHGVKAHLVVVVELEKQRAGGGVETLDDVDLRCRAYGISNRGQINKTVKQMEADVEADLERAQVAGSGWNFKRVHHAWFNTIGWQPIAGGADIPLPERIAAKQACISIKTEVPGGRWDDRCFELALTAWRHPPRDHPQRLNKYDEFYGEWNMRGISVPVTLNDVERFEKQNGVRVNVYGLDDNNDVIPLQLSSYSPKTTDLPECNLLMYGDGTDRHHFVWVVNLQRLLRRSGSHDLYCPRCLQHWLTKSLYDRHMEGNCRDFEAVRTLMPDPDDALLQFKAVKKTLTAPFVVVAELALDTEYKPVGFGMQVVCTFNPELSYYHTHSPEGDAGQEFIAALLQARTLADKHIAHNEPMKLSAEEERQYAAATHCWICHKPGFATAAQIKHNKGLAAKLRVRDHCHFSGKFRGAAHTGCNWSLNWRSWKLPVLMSNLQKVQSHVIVNLLHGRLKDVHCIASNTQQLISFGFNRIRFVDSSRFLYTPPAGTTLRETVVKAAEAWQSFSALCQREDGLDPSHYVSFPSYSLDCALKMRADKGEKPIALFTESDMYTFIEAGIRGGISHTAKRYAKANNKHTPAKGASGGYDPSKPSTYLLYLDATSLYPTCMQDALPSGDYRWEDAAEWTAERIMAMGEADERGAIFRVNLRYPAHLHDFHSDFPCAPERKTVPNCKMSPYYDAHATARGASGEPRHPAQKLICDLEDKQHYIVHYRTLQVYLRLGLELVSVEKVLTFTQTPWLRGFVQHNAAKRQAATSKAEGDHAKLKSNSVSGKLLERVRDRIKYRLVSETKIARKITSKSCFKASTILSDDVFAEGPATEDGKRPCVRGGIVGMEQRKTEVLLDKPIAAGFSVLELSKARMYAFHYETVLRKRPTARLLYCDTDGLIYEVQTDDVVDDIKSDPALHGMLDCSTLPIDNPLHNTHNVKRLGTWHEDAEFSMTEFVALRSKVYAYRTLGADEVKKAGGIATEVTESKLKVEHYLQCLRSGQEGERVQSVRLQSRDHVLREVTADRKGLSLQDDKRYVREDGIETWAYGHWRIVQSQVGSVTAC